MGAERVGIVEPETTTSEALLLSGLGSGVVEVTVAVFRIMPEAVTTVVRIVSVAPLPARIVPREATTVPLVPTGGPVQVPWLGAQDTNVVPGGSGSVTVTPSAVDGPALATVIEWTRICPAWTGLGEETFWIERSALGPAGVGVGVTVAVGVIVVVVVGVRVAVEVLVGVRLGVELGVGLEVEVNVGELDGVNVAV